MEITNIPLNELVPAVWNPNEASEDVLRHLANSIEAFGFVVPLVVRPLGGKYELLSGNQRLVVLAERGTDPVPCVVVGVDDAHARLLAQALNAIHGQDDLGRRALLVRHLLDAMSAEEVARILPDSPGMLQDLAKAADPSRGPTLLDAIHQFEASRRARLQRRSFVLAEADWTPIEEAVARALPRVGEGDEPNRRGLALRLVCLEWLASQEPRPP